MKVEDIVQNIYNANWVLSDEFEINIDNKPGARITQDTWNMCVSSFSMPELSSDVGESVLGGRLKLTTRMYTRFMFTITFRDVGHTDLKKYFEQKFALQQLAYPRDIETLISIYHVDTDGEDKKELFSTRAFITNISGMTFNNAEANIQEFTVSFSAGSFSTSELSSFGTSVFENDVVDLMDFGFNTSEIIEY